MSTHPTQKEKKSAAAAKAFRTLLKRGKDFVIAIPTGWLIVFFLLPFLVVLKISFSQDNYGSPPYLPIVSWEEGRLLLTFSFESYGYIFSDDIYFRAYRSSIVIAFFSTVLALLIGYPMAYYIARLPEDRRHYYLILIILPFWTSFLLRVYAWVGFLKDNGVVNNALMYMGIISNPIQILQTDVAVYIGIVYTYLPFMILPLYANLVKIDPCYQEAASDLGASRFKTFLTVTLPLSLPGILAGSMLVFIPAVGEYVIPALLGGPDTNMIGRVLWDEFFKNFSWSTASAVAILMLVILVIPIMFIRNIFERNSS